MNIVFGTDHSLSSRPLNLVVNGVAVEQVEETELLGVTLECKHIVSIVVKIGRGMFVIKRCSVFLTPHSTKQVLQALV